MRRDLQSQGWQRTEVRKRAETPRTHNVSVVQTLPEGDVGLQVDDDGEVEEDEADHQVLVDGESGAAQGPEGAEDVEADEEGDETDDGETEVGVGHYAGQVSPVPAVRLVHSSSSMPWRHSSRLSELECSSLPDDVDVLQTLRVVRGSSPLPPCPALQPRQAGVAGAGQVRDQGAGDGGQGGGGARRPTQDTVVVPAAPTWAEYRVERI